MAYFLRSRNVDKLGRNGLSYLIGALQSGTQSQHTQDAMNTGWRGQVFGNPNAHYEERAKLMMDADTPISLWCEFGGWENGHPFSSKDTEYQIMRQTKQVQKLTGNSFGQPTYQDREEVTDTIVICGRHIAEMTKSFRAPEAKEIPTLESLEKDDAEYRAGYDAAMERVLNRPMSDDEKERLHP